MRALESVFVTTARLALAPMEADFSIDKLPTTPATAAFALAVQVFGYGQYLTHYNNLFCFRCCDPFGTSLTKTPCRVLRTTTGNLTGHGQVVRVRIRIQWIFSASQARNTSWRLVLSFARHRDKGPQAVQLSL